MLDAINRRKMFNLLDIKEVDKVASWIMINDPPKLDLAYLESWVGEIKLEEYWERLKNEAYSLKKSRDFTLGASSL